MLVGTPHLLTLDEADATWTLIKDKVIEERFGPNVVAVPFLSDAACYDLLGVLVKQSRPAHIRLALPSRQGRRALQPVGPLPNLLEQVGSKGAFAHCTREYSPNGREEIAYEEMRLLDGQPCRIRLHMGGLRKKVAFLLLPPAQVSLQQNLPWLRSTHSIYVIYQVFSCSWLQLGLLPTAQEPQLLRLQRSLPVAFSCLKFSLQPKGVLGPQKPLTKDPLPHGANWVRPNLGIMPPLAPMSTPTDTPEATDVPPPAPATPTPPPQERPEGRPTRFSYKGRNPFRRGPQMLSGSVLRVRQRRMKLRREIQGARPPRSGIGILVPNKHQLLVPNKHQLLLPQTILGPCCFFRLGAGEESLLFSPRLHDPLTL
ncbi:uncharacterized protein C11orf42 homolog isoform X1 [Acinonyx jubatus]|uniref:Uncharacterized protein C11orf42 homolog isoform X1 n=1 Tax=Acinonyx jubatus TaxID=32536 RepID=A0A6J1YTU6_ACIJB|nr:uncharacterized protein C11orf42 homolog isoform X1 [Acinonyx jubatus]